jgi:hypothetical protein
MSGRFVMRTCSVELGRLDSRIMSRRLDLPPHSAAATCVVLAFAIFAIAVGAWGARVAPMTGLYRAEYPQGAIVATLDAQGERLSGSIDFFGKSSARLSGTLQGEYTANGSVTSDAGSSAFSISLRGDKLELAFSVASGAQRAMPPLILTRVAAAVESEKPVPPASTLGDKRLVGSWLHEDEFFGEDAGAPIDEFLEFHADGTYVYRKGQIATDEKKRSFGANRKRKSESGTWRADDGVISVRGAGDDEWIRLGRYAMTEDKRAMRISYDSGNRKLWIRQ